MHDTAPILWLQEWASPAMTDIMLTVSVLGYISSCLAIAAICAFGWNLRLGLTLILAIVFANAITIVAKDVFTSPRPHSVDARVLTPGLESRLARIAARISGQADESGFPSGHVAATAAWALGLAWSRRRPWWTGAAAAWVALMALSRMYLGRHFPVDVLGGFAAGAVGLTIARFAVPQADDGTGTPLSRATTAVGVVLLAVVALTAPFGAGLGVHDAGRFCGLVGGALLLMRSRTLSRAVRPAARIARTAAALVLIGVALWSSTWTIAPWPGLVAISRLAVSIAAYMSVLLVPALVFRGRRS